MNLLNVSFGVYAFLPQGWLFMSFVILMECLIVTRLLLPKWANKQIYSAIILSNVISGIFGIVASMILNGGWALVVWFPWVSKHEINLERQGALQELVLFYLVAFILTLIFEIITNILFLQKRYHKKEILKSTIIANIASYIVGSLVLYCYSFR